MQFRGRRHWTITYQVHKTGSLDTKFAIDLAMQTTRRRNLRTLVDVQCLQDWVFLRSSILVLCCQGWGVGWPSNAATRNPRSLTFWAHLICMNIEHGILQSPNWLTTAWNMAEKLSWRWWNSQRANSRRKCHQNSFRNISGSAVSKISAPQNRLLKTRWYHYRCSSLLRCSCGMYRSMEQWVIFLFNWSLQLIALELHQSTSPRPS